MKVVILAGGFGTRISEESQFKPKPMIEIGGKPILWHIMKWYSKFGHNEFRWVLSIPFFISCIRQQNPLTVLSKIILRKVKQFNLPPQKK